MNEISLQKQEQNHDGIVKNGDGFGGLTFLKTYLYMNIFYRAKRKRQTSASVSCLRLLLLPPPPDSNQHAHFRVDGTAIAIMYMIAIHMIELYHTAN